MDQVGLPIVLAWQLRRFAPKDWRHVRKAADLIVEKGPISEQERWENQEGYSPATIAAEIAGLVCAADIATRNGDGKRAAKYLAKADGWAAERRALDGDHQRPLLGCAVLPARDQGPQARQGDQVRDRRLRSFGARPAPRRRRQLPRARPPGRQARRRSDGPEHARGRRQPAQGRAASGTASASTATASAATGSRGGCSRTTPAGRSGRAWPIFAGERGEYELLAGRPATALLAAMAGTANGGGMLPEQVWDGREPTGRPGFTKGQGTFSATPLAWTHAQLVRLAWSAEAGTPVERPAIVANRYSRARRVGAILPCRPRAGAGFSFAARRIHEPTTLGARLSWPAETSGSQ